MKHIIKKIYSFKQKHQYKIWKNNQKKHILQVNEDMYKGLA